MALSDSGSHYFFSTHASEALLWGCLLTPVPQTWDWIVSVLGSVLQVPRPGGASHGCAVDRLPLRCRAAGLLAPACAGGWAGLPSSSNGPAPGTPRQTVFYRDIGWCRVQTVYKASYSLSPTRP